MKVVTEETESILWNKLYKEYKLTIGMDNQEEWISNLENSKVYHKEIPWTDAQEELINSFLEELVESEMYALDWQHDCFIFSPKEHIPCNYEYYDFDRECQVYFPTYYPNGDYHFFMDKEWKYGIYGHPWRNEIIVMGKELVEKFESNLETLGLK